MNITETLAQLEKMRNEHNIFNVLGIFSMVVCVVIFAILGETSLTGDMSPLLILICFAGFIGGLFLLSKAGRIKKQFRYLYKNTFLVGLLNQYFTNLYCDWDKGFSEDYVRDIGLTQWGNKFHSEDYMRGMYKGVEFEQSDVTVQHVQRSGKHTHTYTYFRGRMFSFTCPKTDYMSTVLFSRSFNYKGPGGKFRYEKVKMESIQFNDEFKLKAVRPHDAFYILTPQLMECIRNLYHRYGNVAMHYYYGKLYLAVNMDSDAFDADMHRPINYNQEMEKMRWDIGVICDIIDTLSLYPIIQQQPMNQASYPMQSQPVNQTPYQMQYQPSNQAPYCAPGQMWNQY